MGFGRRYDGQRLVPAARVALRRIVCIAFCALPPLTSARAETADIAIHIHDRQTSGLAWRGSMLPNLMHGPFMFGQLHNSAPSAILCVVRVRGEVVCPGGGRGGVSSPCPMAYDCTFEDVALPDDPLFGLIFVSQGMIERALVDAVIVTRAHMARSDEKIAALDPIMRAVEARLAPAGPTEAARRSRRFPIMELAKCDLPCSLDQSEFKLTVGER